MKHCQQTKSLRTYSQRAKQEILSAESLGDADLPDLPDRFREQIFLHLNIPLWLP